MLKGRSKSQFPAANAKLTAKSRPVSAVRASDASRALAWPAFAGSMLGRTCRATLAAQLPVRAGLR
jgi:hypothetical protein